MLRMGGEFQFIPSIQSGLGRWEKNS